MARDGLRMYFRMRSKRGCHWSMCDTLKPTPRAHARATSSVGTAGLSSQSHERLHLVGSLGLFGRHIRLCGLFRRMTELQAIARAFRHNHDIRTNPLRVGSVEGNIG